MAIPEITMNWTSFGPSPHLFLPRPHIDHLLRIQTKHARFVYYFYLLWKRSVNSSEVSLARHIIPQSRARKKEEDCRKNQNNDWEIQNTIESMTFLWRYSKFRERKINKQYRFGCIKIEKQQTQFKRSSHAFNWSIIWCAKKRKKFFNVNIGKRWKSRETSVLLRTLK